VVDGLQVSDRFTKLFESILDSTIWFEDSDTRCIWITMLALADADGIVSNTVPGLARRALPQMSLGEAIAKTETVLAAFQQPDPYSRTPDNEGRRIAPVDGGWELLNHRKYREKRLKAERREQNRAAQQRYRERKRASADSNQESAKAEAEAEAEAPPPPTPSSCDGGAQDFDAWRSAYRRGHQQLYGFPVVEGPKFGEHLSVLVRWGRDAGVTTEQIETICARFFEIEDVEVVDGKHWIGWLVPRVGHLLNGTAKAPLHPSRVPL
jgi:hypothetical protein